MPAHKPLQVSPAFLFLMLSVPILAFPVALSSDHHCLHHCFQRPLSDHALPQDAFNPPPSARERPEKITSFQIVWLCRHFIGTRAGAALM